MDIEEQSRHLADEWHGKWDIIITYPNEQAKDAAETEHVQPKERAMFERMRTREKRRLALINRMRECGLIVVPQKSQDDSFVMLKITAPTEVFDREAARLEISLPLKQPEYKRTTDSRYDTGLAWLDRLLEKIRPPRPPLDLGYMKFDPSKKDMFETLDSRFYKSMDRQRLIMSILRAKCFQGGCDIDFIKECRGRVFKAVFPLHTRRGQKRMVEKWLMRGYLKFRQPVGLIQGYFGEKVAFYFAYLGFYTKWLLFLSVPGVVTFLWCLSSPNETLDLNHDITIFYAIFISLWVSLFLEGWKRKQSTIAFRLNVQDLKVSTDPRPQFRGKLVKGRVTRAGLIKYKDMEEIPEEQLEKIQEYVFWYSPIKRFFKYFLGTPVISTFVLGVVFGTFALLAFKTFLEQEGVQGGGVFVSFLNALFIIVMNQVYQRVAVMLTDFENHRTDLDYENALIAKTFVFQFINSYIALFFIAFIKGPPIPGWALTDPATGADLTDLPPEFSESARYFGHDIGYCNYDSCMMDLFFQLATIVIAKQLLSNFAELGMPLLFSKVTFFRQAYKAYENSVKKADQGEDGLFVKAKELTATARENMPFFEKQAAQAKFPGIFYEMNELAIQFGYMTMFATAFPLASVLALVNNIFEVHVDANKILFATKRPQYEGAQDIGTWLYVLETLSVLAVMTNAAIICFTSETLKGGFRDRTDAEYLSCVNPACATIATAIIQARDSMVDGAATWQVGGNLTDLTADLQECLFECSCKGRCLAPSTRLLIFVLGEHIILLFKYLLDVLIPDLPSRVAKARLYIELVNEMQEAQRKSGDGTEFQVKDVKSWDENDSEDDDEYWDTETERAGNFMQRIRAAKSVATSMKL